MDLYPSEIDNRGNDIWTRLSAWRLRISLGIIGGKPSFTEQDIAELIACPKEVVDPPRREMKVDGRMRRNEMTLKSVDCKHEFRVFLRQSDEFQENFFIGLIYLPHEDPGEFVLIRCNGPHGGTRTHSHHAVYHVHQIRAEDVNSGVKEPRAIEHTSEYASFPDAIRVFCHRVRLEDADRYFPGLIQRHLFPGEEVQL